VSEGLVSIKVRINTECGDIEIYFNEETQTITSALIVKGERVFGINGYPESKAWHMHPLGEVKRHVKIEPMDLEDIIREYAKAIVNYPKLKLGACSPRCALAACFGCVHLRSSGLVRLVRTPTAKRPHRTALIAFRAPLAHRRHEAG